MENNILNLAVEQMKSNNINDIFRKQSFFEEYSKVFCEISKELIY